MIEYAPPKYSLQSEHPDLCKNRGSSLGALLFGDFASGLSFRLKSVLALG